MTSAPLMTHPTHPVAEPLWLNDVQCRNPVGLVGQNVYEEKLERNRKIM